MKCITEFPHATQVRDYSLLQAGICYLVCFLKKAISEANHFTDVLILVHV